MNNLTQTKDYTIDEIGINGIWNVGNFLAQKTGGEVCLNFSLSTSAQFVSNTMYKISTALPQELTPRGVRVINAIGVDNNWENPVPVLFIATAFRTLEILSKEKKAFFYIGGSYRI